MDDLKFSEVIMVVSNLPRNRLVDHIGSLDGISLSVRDLGVTFDQDQSFNSHMKWSLAAAFFISLDEEHADHECCRKTTHLAFITPWSLSL